MDSNFEQTSFLFGSNAVFIEELYERYLSNPDSVDDNWRIFFQKFAENEARSLISTSKVIFPEHFIQRNISTESIFTSNNAENQLRAKFMIAAYRTRAHYLANLDPLALEQLRTKSELKLNIEDFGFSNDSLNTTINLNGEFDGLDSCTLNDLVKLLDKTYCDSIAVEFNHIENINEQKWLFNEIEQGQTHSKLTELEKKKALADLVEIEGFEQYLHTKFPGAKRFSIEGGDSSILVLNRFIEIASSQGVEDIVIGMAHRGRLSTLTKVMGKPYKAILSEFLGISAFPKDLDVAGDVKYHMGYSSDKITKEGKKIHLSLTPNPSHLEAVNPVVSGKVRAKQDFIKDISRKKVAGLLVHGDAAFCGQGVVAENLVMSGLSAYQIGGVLHLVINNQVGFTANAKDTRSGRYATEVAKMVGAPILHVNGDDIEAVLLATDIASNYRQKFGKDVVIDIICYRKYGHNEGDEPMYTQSVMYNVIKDKKTPATIYAEKLVNSSIIDNLHLSKIKDDFKIVLDKEYADAKNYKPHAQWLDGMWSGYTRSDSKDLQTGVNKSVLKELGLKLCTIPNNFPLNPKLSKLFEQRADVLQKDTFIDWATGEQLAFGSLLNEGIPIRLTGQDCGRGTFSHRHSVLHSQVDDSLYIPLNNLNKNQAHYFVADSNLSEYGVLGFEYGYSLVNPNHLVIWEAQFGDFANGAQIIFDQFITSSETKWLRMSGLVVLLPHGFEGQGPEHSSARLERFLQAAADNNIQVTYPTTPASFFHLLRRQIYNKSRKPLIVMTPKSLLRHKHAVSKLDDLAEGSKFVPIIDEINAAILPNNVKRVVLCSGKVYYDLLEMRNSNNIKDIAIIRLEQLYPFSEDLAINVLTKYKSAQEFIWCQEEPKNMGAWNFIHNYLDNCIKKASLKSNFRYVGRDASASPAVGYLYLHNKQQEKLVMEALNVKGE